MNSMLTDLLAEGVNDQGLTTHRSLSPAEKRGLLADFCGKQRIKRIDISVIL